MTPLFYSVGCSMAAGVELFSEISTLSRKDLMKIITFDSKNLRDRGFGSYADYNDENNFPRQMANALGFEHYQAARGGFSNDLIILRAVIDLTRLREQYPNRDIYALISWSSLYRGFNFMHKSDSRSIRSYIPLTPGASLDKNHTLYKRHAELYLGEHVVEYLHNQVIFEDLVRRVCDKLKIKFAFITGIADYILSDLKVSTPHLDQTLLPLLGEEDYINIRFPKEIKTIYDYLDWRALNNFSTFTSENKYKLCPGGHPGVEANSKYAEYLLPRFIRHVQL